MRMVRGDPIVAAVRTIAVTTLNLPNSIAAID
jgi:hypothetical protein